MTARARFLPTLGALALAAGLTAPDTPRAENQQFRSGTELVSVYATVQDKDRRLVPDLRQEDFVISDNGKDQPITFFSNEVSPFTVVVLLDWSGSMVEHQPVVRDAASAFVRQMLPADQARIGNFGNRIWFNPPAFTGSQPELLAALRAPSGSAGASPVWLALDQSLNALSGIEGRRVVLMLTDGHDSPARNHMRTSFKDVSERVKRAGVMIYAIGFASTEVRSGRPRIRTARRRPEEAGGRERRRVLRAGGHGEYDARVHARRRGTASPILAGVCAAETRRQAAQHPGQGEAVRHDGPRPPDLPGAGRREVVLYCLHA